MMMDQTQQIKAAEFVYLVPLNRASCKERRHYSAYTTSAEDPMLEILKPLTVSLGGAVLKRESFLLPMQRPRTRRGESVRDDPAFQFLVDKTKGERTMKLARVFKKINPEVTVVVLTGNAAQLILN